MSTTMDELMDGLLAEAATAEPEAAERLSGAPDDVRATIAAALAAGRCTAREAVRWFMPRLLSADTEAAATARRELETRAALSRPAAAPTGNGHRVALTAPGGQPWGSRPGERLAAGGLPRATASGLEVAMLADVAEPARAAVAAEADRATAWAMARRYSGPEGLALAEYDALDGGPLAEGSRAQAQARAAAEAEAMTDDEVLTTYVAGRPEVYRPKPQDPGLFNARPGEPTSDMLSGPPQPGRR